MSFKNELSLLIVSPELELQPEADIGDKDFNNTSKRSWPVSRAMASDDSNAHIAVECILHTTFPMFVNSLLIWFLSIANRRDG